MTLKKWVDGYVRAWRTNDPADIRALFTDDAEYYTAPFRPPWRGVDAIVEGWLDRQDEPGEYSFDWEPVVDGDELGILRGVTTYPDETFSNLWVIRFAPDGRATEFTEWFMEHSRSTES
ncbi:nuclear transport factor 2 family protein [Allorhizocola rhizosphaerae]|uniref:nuclear transport factor 2 family protein n=1 Tax=Allorhizocola rhizosphaerae TaxID=1872709 RepID=UPI000E3B958C|nr:nuclear transport factor 2 family protein [Allorhizocola rhizosphaerae]